MKLAYAWAAQKKLELALIVASGLIGIVSGDSDVNATETESRRKPSYHYPSYPHSYSSSSTNGTGTTSEEARQRNIMIVCTIAIVGIVVMCVSLLLLHYKRTRAANQATGRRPQLIPYITSP